jgi:glycine amidinotransferase/scyllo-inosamine-4-phosphate amidinotransferase 1
MKINSYNEWDTLREVIVGTVDNMTIGLEFSDSKPVSHALFEKAAKIAKKAIPDWYKNEVSEDINDLCKIFTEFGVKVFHPTPYGSEKLFCTPDWCARGKDIYNVRDIHLVVGDKVIVSPSATRCRYFEPNAFYDIWYHYFNEGFTWITAPKAKLAGTYLTPYYQQGKEIITKEDILHRKLSGGRGEKWHRLTEDEILFDAANVVRFGKDLIYLVSSTGNHKGSKWLQSILGEEYRVHTTSAYRSSHIDSTILPLHPGLVLLNGARVNSENCPKILNNWEKIYFSDVAPVPQEEIDFQKNVRDKVYHELSKLGIETDLNHISSPWAGLNVFSLNPQTVLVHDKQTKLIKKLKEHKLTVIPVRMRHCYTMLGGLHCSTLDTVRDGGLESYFD